jgi:hypothetical protein
VWLNSEVIIELPHKHSPHSKHSRRKRARQQFLRELWRMPKVYDYEKGECIALQNSKHLEQGEVIYAPNFQSPFLNHTWNNETHNRG